MLAGRPGAKFQCDRHIHRFDHGLKNLGHQRFIGQQGRTRRLAAHFFGRTAHVDVDDLGAQISVAACRVGQHLCIAASDLHDARPGLPGEVHTQPRFARVPQAGIAGEHLCHGIACAPFAADLPEWAVGDAGHGRERDRAVEGVGSELHPRIVRNCVKPAAGRTAWQLHFRQNTYAATIKSGYNSSDRGGFRPPFFAHSLWTCEGLSGFES